jgi:AbrB family looped-hinge helix DNA binding protein
MEKVGQRREEIVKVSRNYQVTIPASIRQKFFIREGDLVKIIYNEENGELKVERLHP